ncbi:MAG: OmpA family protein, partial [Pseudomonadota bacterium]
SGGCVSAECAMVHHMKLLGLIGIFLAGCTALPPEKTPALGPAFNEGLQQDYIALAGSAWSAGDWDFIHFNQKAADATLGDQVWPDRVASRRMSSSARETMLDQRARLVYALEASARRQSPREAAKAQVSFDCWLWEVASGARPDQPSGCGETFMEEMAKVEAKQRDLPDSYSVFFETGSALLSVPARNTVTDSVRALEVLDGEQVDVVGFADPTGSTTVNQALADDRALAVVEALLQAGVPADMINAAGAGTTTSGATDAQDRRVDITVIR